MNIIRSETRHEITCDQRSVLLLEDAYMAARMAGRVKNPKHPSRVTGEFEAFILLECPIDLHNALKIPSRDGMRGDSDSSPLLEMIRSAHMIAVEVRQPDLPDFTLLEQSVEQCLLFLVWRRRIRSEERSCRERV